MSVKANRILQVLKFLILFNFLFNFFGAVLTTRAAVSDLCFGYGKTLSPNTLPTSWTQDSRPDSVSYEYQVHQESYNFNSGEYVCFQIGLSNIDSPASVVIDKIELTGPSGPILISNSDFENGTSDWSAWGSRNVAGDFSISSDAYEGSSAAKLTISNSGQYSIHSQVPVPITQSGNYILSVYTKVYEAEREILPDDVFAMEVGNQWLYDYGHKREITNIDSTTFGRNTYEMTYLQNGTQYGKEFYEVWKGYVRFWGIFDYDLSFLIRFGFGLLAMWLPATVGDYKESMTWVLNYATEADLIVDVLGIESVILAFDTLDAYRVRYNYEITGPGGTATTSYDWWIVPHIGIVKEQTTGGTIKLVSFAIHGGTITETSDNDNDGLKDYKELITYNTNPTKLDTDSDGMPDGWEIQYGLNPLINDAKEDADNDRANNLLEFHRGTNPIDANSKPSKAMPWLLLLDD